MAINASELNRLVSISQFNKGQAAKIFERAKNEGQIIVLKNNTPEAIILSPGEYARLCEIVEDHELLLLAEERLANSNLANAVDEAELMAHLGIVEADVDAAEELEIE